MIDESTNNEGPGQLEEDSEYVTEDVMASHNIPAYRTSCHHKPVIPQKVENGSKWGHHKLAASLGYNYNVKSRGKYAYTVTCYDDVIQRHNLIGLEFPRDHVTMPNGPSTRMIMRAKFPVTNWANLTHL